MKLYISETQSPISIINTLSHIEEREIELIFPENSSFFNDPENLELLKNHARLLAKEILIVASKPEEVSVSQSHDIKPKVKGIRKDEIKERVAIEEPFFEEIEKDLESENHETQEFTKRYFDLSTKKAPHEIEEVDLMKEPPPKIEEPLFEERERIASEEPLEEELKTLSQREWKFALYKIGVAGISLGLLALGYLYLPKATVELFALREKISFSFEVSAKKGLSIVDVETRTIPVQLIQITKELSQPFEIKEKGSFSQKAKGSITVYNENATPQFMIPSRFQAQNGSIYWSQRNIRIPARGSLEIEAAADKPGEPSNLTCSQESPCSFTIPAWKGTQNFKKIYAKATTPITGGVQGEGFILLEQDYEKAEKALRSELLREGQKALLEQIPQKFTLLQDSIRSEVVEISSAPALNGLSQDGKAIMKGKVNLVGFLIRESDLKELADLIVKTQLAEDKETKPDTIAVEYTIKNINFEENGVALEVMTSEETAFKVGVEDLKRKLAGKSEEEVRTLLAEIPTIQSAKVTLWPFWVRTIPKGMRRIEIEVR